MKLATDSSVLAKLYLDEEDTDKVDELVSSSHELAIGLTAGELVVYEVGNVLRFRDPGNPKNPERVDELYHTGIEFMRFGPKDAVETSRLADAEHLTYYDAAHLHLARKAGATLVTEDKALLRKKGTISLANALKHIRRLERFES